MNRGAAWGRRLLGAHAALVYLFLYVPILILIIFSFNSQRLNVSWEGFTLRWYADLFSDRQIGRAVGNSLVVAAVSTVVATAIGTLTAFAFSRHQFRGRRLLEGLLYVPIILPEIIMGISLLVVFVTLGMELGRITIIIAHITFSISFVFVVVRARLHDFDRNLERAAMDLGCNEYQTFMKVTLPLVWPGILAGALLALTLSIDDVIISFFTSGPGSTTLPIYIYGMVRVAVRPTINALATILMVVTLTAVVIAQRLQNRRA